MVNDGASRGCAKGVTVSTSYHLPVTLLFREIACMYVVRKKSIASSSLDDVSLRNSRISIFFMLEDVIQAAHTISIKVSSYTRSYLPRPVKPKKCHFGRCFWSKIYLAEENFIVHYPDIYVNKYVFLSFMSLLLKRASVVSDRLDIAGVRRRRINTRDVYHPISLSLSPAFIRFRFLHFGGLSSCLSSCPRSRRTRATSLTSVCLTSSSPPRPDSWIRSTLRD